ncbi:mobilization protein [Streptomyces sp. NBC_01433]|uniref:mobilization protein n=1 Tax=Streptomyces sp. NBC_01433 TaxID=2903864 RepID=UPI002255CF45|nr:mobilization protein [Streptomyces sp. NBC_01433]MCX4676030.1 mobilization protein [Streptomyces sp. NBC_01433]
MHEHLTPAPTDRQQARPIPANSGASWRFGHSPAGGASEPAPAPGVAGPDRRQGAPDGKAATEGGSQPSRAVRKRRPKGKSRPRDKKQRPAHSVRLNEREHTIIQTGADAVGMSIAGFLAHSALAAARDQTRTAVSIAADHDVLTELFATGRKLGWAGSNLNQMTKTLNSGGDIARIEEALADVRRAATATRAAVERINNHQKDETA